MFQNWQLQTGDFATGCCWCNWLLLPACYLPYKAGQESVYRRFSDQISLDNEYMICSYYIISICLYSLELWTKVECLPVFVANSSEMLVLWDDTYFQRLWCNMEVACFIKHAGPERVRFLPLWIAPWLLSSMLLDLISATIFEVLELSFPNWSMAWVAQVEAAVLAMGSPPELTRFFAAFFIWMFSGLCYLPSSVPSFFSFRAKLRSHTLLLEQMSSFRVQEAKCTEENDRHWIEEQVVELYGDTAESAAGEECEHQHELERFNRYIQGPLRKVVLKSIGDELSVPYHLCLIAYLPMTFYSAVNVLGCDNGPCMVSVKEGGFSSLEIYLMVQAGAWFLCMLLAFPMTYPTLLFCLQKLSPSDDSLPSSCAASIFCLVAFAYGFFLGACIWGIAFCLATGITVIRLAVAVVVLAFLLFQTYMTFLKPRGDQENKPMEADEEQNGTRSMRLAEVMVSPISHNNMVSQTHNVSQPGCKASGAC